MMFEDLLDGEAQREWHHWSATAFAHAFLGFGAALVLALLLSPLWAVLVAAAGYAVWEARQGLFWDGLLDFSAWTLGACMLFWPLAGFAAVLVVAFVGARVRHG